MMVDVVVEYEYIATQDDELTLKVGDVVNEVSKHDGGWWEGLLNGKRGMFPDNFVKEIKPEKDKVKEPTAAPKKSSGGGSSSHVAELANKLHKDGGIKMGPPTKHVSRRESKRKVTAKVTYSYTPQNEDELRLELGDIVEVLKQEEEGWWEGSLNGHVGVFPSNFVELIDTQPDSEQTPQEEEEPQQAKGTRAKGFGMGNIFSDGPIKLKSTSGRPEQGDVAQKKEATENHKQSVPPVPAPEQKTRPAPPPPTSQPTAAAVPHKAGKPCERARVLYTYEAEVADELSLQEGEVITILDKDLEDKGWWKGEIRGKTGVFPDNFVELLPPEQAVRPQKPPPPGNAPVSKTKEEQPPPLPEPSVKTRKDKDDHQKDNKLGKSARSLDEKAPSEGAKPTRPASLHKKAAAPPPVRKKPNKPADPKVSAQTDGHTPLNNTEQQDGKPEAAERTSPERAKVPLRRTPSKEHQNEKEEKASPTRTARPRSVRKEASKSPQRTSGPPKAPVAAERPESTAEATSPPDGAVVEALQKELAQLRANTVSREQYEELQTELQHLRESLEQVKTTINKRVYDLMAEVDDEKKIRLNTQVEIERLKKLVMS